jgi:hypothetical protein
LLVAALVGAAPAVRAQTTSAITPEDLRRRLLAFADDSMLGRATATRGHVKATEYLARELARMHLKPAGDKNTFYQDVKMDRVKVDLDDAMLTIGGSVTLKAGVDYVPIVGHFGVPFASAAAKRTIQQLMFRQSLGDIVDAEFIAQLRADTMVYNDRVPDSLQLGKPIIVLRAASRADGKADYQVWNAAPRAEQYRGASAVLVEALDLMPRSVLAELMSPGLMLSQDIVALQDPRNKVPVKIPPVPPVLAITRSAMNALRITPSLIANLRFQSEVSPPGVPTRNVVAMIEGSDFRSEVVVLSAHADHGGIVGPAMQIDGDSIMNGADIGGSGSVALLEIAEHLASSRERPRRTIVFLWTVGEEQGMLGSQWFASHAVCTTVDPHPERETLARNDHCQTDAANGNQWIGTVVANINVDAIGHGGAGDIEHGGPDYVQVIGATQLSDEFAHWVDKLTHDPQYGLRTDAEYDVTQPHKRASCTGDHWSFARLGIPSLFITTGAHADTRSVADAPGTIDYEKLAKVTRFVSGLTLGVANRDDRPTLDDPVLGPLALCGQ